MGVQAGCPSSNPKHPSSEGGAYQVPKLVVDSLSEVNDYKTQVSWEEWTLSEPHVLVEMVKRTVKIIVTSREGT